MTKVHLENRQNGSTCNSIMKRLLTVTIKKTFVFNSSQRIHVIQLIIITAASGESASEHR